MGRRGLHGGAPPRRRRRHPASRVPHVRRAPRAPPSRAHGGRRARGSPGRRRGEGLRRRQRAEPHLPRRGARRAPPRARRRRPRPGRDHTGGDQARRGGLRRRRERAGPPDGDGPPRQAPRPRHGRRGRRRPRARLRRGPAGRDARPGSPHGRRARRRAASRGLNGWGARVERTAPRLLSSGRQLMSFQGSLNELPLADIVQLVAVSGKTGMFSMTRASEKGYVYLQNGQITHAKVGDVEGDDAIYALALWNQGTFQFSPGVESDAHSITRSNTNLLLEAARRSDEWKILSRKIPATDSVPVLIARDGMTGPVTLTPLEWRVVTKTDGQRSIEDIARSLKLSSFDVAKTLYGLVTAELVEISKARGAAPAVVVAVRPVVGASAPPPMPPVTGQSVPNVSTHSGAFQALSKGDEKRSLQILCTKVKQEAEAAAAAPGDSTIDRPYRT